MPPLLLFARDPHSQIDWPLIKTTFQLYLLALAVYFLVQLCRTPNKLDRDREVREIELTQTISSLELTVEQRDGNIRTLTEHPPRSAAEQHDYDTVKDVLKVTGEKGLAALRHIRKHRSLKFGIYPPVLAPGLKVEDMIWVYNHAASEGVLTADNGKVGTGERTFSISPKMEKVLDELLFETS